MDAPPDYASCSLAELVVLRGRINRRKFPERYQEVVNLIQQRQPNLTNTERELFKSIMMHDQNVRVVSFAFVCGGPLFFIYGFLSPLFLTLQARSWIPTTCIIRHVQSHGFSTRKLLYDYTFDGRRYESSQLTTSYNDTRDNKWVQRYPDHSQAQCFVNPFHPQEATLTRDFRSTSYFLLLWSLAATGIGIYGIRRPEQIKFSGGNPWTPKELRRLSYEDIRNRDSK